MKRDPQTWEPPRWHEDFGNAQGEFLMLRSFSLALIKSGKGYDVELDCFEEGYMKVDIFKGHNAFGELYVVERENRLEYALFTNIGKEDEDEIYFSSVEDGLSLL